MAAIDLLFGQAPNAPGSPVEIVFGDDSGAPAVTVDLLASGAITGLRGTITANVATRLVAGGSITGLRGTITANVATRLVAGGSITGLRGAIAVPYDVNVDRPLAAATRSGWQNTQRLRTSQQQRFEQASPIYAALQTRWQNAAHLGAAHQARWQQTRTLSTIVRQALQQARPVASAPALQRFEQAARLRTTTQQRLQQARAVPAAPTAQRFEDAARLRHLVRSSFEQTQHALQAAVRSTFGHGVPVSRVIAVNYEQARKPPPGVSRPAPPPQPAPCYLPTLPAHLLFADLADSSLPARLVFACEQHTGPVPGEPIVIPTLRVYIVSNDIILRRASDNAEVPCIGMSLALDSSSWTWGFDATLPAAALDMVQPDSSGPVELQALVNGTTFTVLAERVSRERVFGKAALRVSGRGRNAELDAPYAPTMVFGNTAARTHQQLFADVLSINGVPMGYTIDYQLQDWLVPAGVWSVQGTYIAALSSLAQAAGAYLRPHTSDLAFAVLPLYPAWPPDSATPDIILPPDVLTRESVAWIDRPAYNRVFVRGQNQGVLAQVTRAGSAGDVLAPMVTDALITDITAARQRAISIFGATGRKLDVSLSLPVLPATGVIQPGTYVQYADGAATRLGIVRSVSVQVDGQVSVLQTIGVEAHA